MDSLDRRGFLATLAAGAAATAAPLNVIACGTSRPHADYEVRAATPWNYGLVVDDSTPDATEKTLASIHFEEGPVGERPFSPEGAGMIATARGRRMPGWKIVNGWAGEIATGDQQASDPARPTTDQPVEQITLIPYGCTNIRITEFPKVAASQ